MKNFSSNYGFLKKGGYLVFLAVLGIFLTLRLSSELRYNLTVVHMMKVVLPIAAESHEVLLTDVQYRHIVAEFQRIQKIHPEDVRVQYHLGWLDFWSGNYEKVIQEFGPCPNKKVSPLAVFLCGYAQWNLGQSDGAVLTWRSVPDIASYFLTRASDAEYGRDFGTAKELYSLGARIAQDPSAAQAGYWFTYAMSLLQQEEQPSINVDEVFEQAIRQNSTSFRRQLWLGSELVYKSKLVLAEEALALALDLEPRSYWAIYFQGLLLYKKGAYQDAEQCFRETLSIASDFVNGVHWLARVLVKMGREDEALVYYRQAVRLLPGDAQITSELKALEASKP